jgi:hypothetical protein
MSPTQPPPGLNEALDENTVRHLCGAGAFAKADRLQRDGRVLSPTLIEGGLEASVRGTWRRVDEVRVIFRGGRLLPACTRDGNTFCRHVGAMLLQYARKPGTFTVNEPADDQGDGSSQETGWTAAGGSGAETPAAELTRLLDTDTAHHLRVIARNRGVRLSGTKKADLVAQLVACLAEPDGIDAALAGTTPPERVAVDAVHLMSAFSPAQGRFVQDGFQALGGTGDAPLEALRDRGLIFDAHRQLSNLEGYVVPRAVGARLATIGTLAGRARDADAVPAEPGRLGITELIQSIAQATIARRIKRRRRLKKRDVAVPLPASIEPDPKEYRGGVIVLTPDNATGIRLVPEHVLVEADLAQLASALAQRPESIEFAVRLMYALKIAETTSGVMTVRFDRLQALLDEDAAARLQRLTQAWRSVPWPSTYEALFGPEGYLDTRLRPSYNAYHPPLQHAVGAAAKLVARLVSRMEPNVDYDLASFVATFARLAPNAAPDLTQLRTTVHPTNAMTLAFRAIDGTREPLALKTPEGWDRFITALVSAVLAGPLTWLR